MSTIRRLLFPSFLVVFSGFSLSAYGAEDNFMDTANLKEIRFLNDDVNDQADLEVEIQNETYERGSDLDSLIHAKFKIINGELKLARFYLNRINENTSKVYTIKKRYLALISFIEGNFSQSLIELQDKRFMENSIYPQICLLKLINFMAVNDTKSLRSEKNDCMIYTRKTSKNDAYWLDTMIKLKLKDLNGIKKNILVDVEKSLTDDDMSKLWLKTGLYLNKEKYLIELISLLPESSYQSKRLREIIAFMYLRSDDAGDIKKALSFIDDIDSANAENIKGTVNLQNKEYELAFGHFRLALQKKQDSANSLERALPLAWILNQWKDGLHILNSNTNQGLDPRNKQAIKIAFLIREQKYLEAEKELLILKKAFKNKLPLEINIMDSYVSLILSNTNRKYDIRNIEDPTEAACKSFDGFSCWISLQLLQWENIGKKIKRNDEIFSDKEMSIESLKEKKVILPLEENITVDQKDIEDLDSSTVQIK